VAALCGDPQLGIREIAVEASSLAIHIAHALRAEGLPVAVYEARQVSRYLRLRKNKTDRNDALGLAEIAKLHLPSIASVFVKSPAIHVLRSRLVLRAQVARQKLAYERMLHSFIRLYGGRMKSSRSDALFASNALAQAAQLKAGGQPDISPEVASLVDLCLCHRKLLKVLDTQLADWVRDHPVCAPFLEVPGIGPICAVSFYTAIEDPTRFRCAADVGPYLGLTPRISQSGSSLRTGRISRAGNSLTRSHLNMAAGILLSPRTRDNPLSAWALQLAARAGRGKARTALARRLAVTLLAMWKSGQSFDPGLAIERAPR
jgi:transposase